jgi:UDP-N-acetylglucosamine acyltransferase
LTVHSSAIVGDKVLLGENVKIGPYVVIQGDTHIGDHTEIMSHASIGSENGIVRIGEKNVIHQGAIVGGTPQDLLYDGEKTRLEIGDSNTIREFVTVNTGTTKDKGVTRIGNKNLFMAYVHIAHDCHIFNNVVIANSTQLAGHVTIEDNVTIGGVCGLSQFIRIGKFAYIGGNSTFNKDILPFSIAEGRWGVMRATNKVGLFRAGYTKDDLDIIHKALKIFIRGKKTVAESIDEVFGLYKNNNHIQYLLQFAESSKKGLAR